MSTHGLTGTSMSLSSERTYSKVKSHFRLFHLPFGWVETFIATLVENAGGLRVGEEILLSLSRINSYILDVQLKLLKHRSISISFWAPTGRSLLFLSF